MTRIPRLLFLVCTALVWGTAGAAPLNTVLGFIPVQFENPILSITDWTRIRADEGLDHLTSGSPLEERVKLLISTTTRQAAPSAFGASWFPLQAEFWGWDTADHVWEANLILDNLPPLWLVHVAEWVDLDALAARFRDRGFSEETSFGAVVFRHPLDLTADWLRVTKLAILNTAILFGERLLVMCSAPEGVEAVLAARAGAVATWADVPWAVSLAQLLEGVSGAGVLLGPSTCLSFSGGDVLNALLASSRRLKTLLEEGPPLQPYVALAVGYETHKGEPVGLFVLHYLTEEMAHADLPARTALAEEGVSLPTRAPYRESAFTVRAASVEGTSVVLRVNPTRGQPARILFMFYARDLVFALCP